jgi:hypothetical protein
MHGIITFIVEYKINKKDIEEPGISSLTASRYNNIGGREKSRDREETDRQKQRHTSREREREKIKFIEL